MVFLQNLVASTLPTATNVERGHNLATPRVNLSRDGFDYVVTRDAGKDPVVKLRSGIQDEKTLALQHELVGKLPVYRGRFAQIQEPVARLAAFENHLRERLPDATEIERGASKPVIFFTSIGEAYSSALLPNGEITVKASVPTKTAPASVATLEALLNK